MGMKLEPGNFCKLLVRPTVVISTLSPNGISNAAPFSFVSDHIAGEAFVTEMRRTKFNRDGD